MRHNLLLVAVLAAAVPATSVAEESTATPVQPAPAPDEGGPSEVDLNAIANDESSRDFGGAASEVETVVGGSGGTMSATGEHTVERGDTLWDLSGKYLGNPWYWPKVWSYNPQIENPHWIYPGDEIRLQGEDGRPMASPLPADSDVSVAGRIGADVPGSALVRTWGLVSEQELAASGTLAKSWEEKNLLHEGDRIYVTRPQGDDLQVGVSYVIYRTDRPLSHPETGASMGYLSRVLGNAKVVEADPDKPYVTAVIQRSFSEIERGDRIGPAGDNQAHRVSPTPNEVEVAGLITATLEQNMAELGQGHVVFLDRGSRDGIKEGNVLEVVRAGDGLDDDGYTPYYDESLPEERIGKLLIVDAKEHVSAALVTGSIRELRIGDRVEMQASAE